MKYNKSRPNKTYRKPCNRCENIKLIKNLDNVRNVGRKRE